MKEQPRVLNKRTDQIPPDAIYVGRPSKWGNPFRIGEKHPADGHRIDRDEALELYRNALPLMFQARRDDGTIILDLNELRGKDLVCWCHTWNGEGKNPHYCHADILLELANK